MRSKFGDLSSSGVPIGGLVQLIEPIPGYIRCDGNSLYTTGTIFNDLLTTTLTVAPIGAAGGAYQCDSSGAIIVCIGGSLTSLASRSINGINWTSQTLPPIAGGFFWQTVCWTGSKFVAAAGGSSAGQDEVNLTTSVDGITWTALANLGIGNGTHQSRAPRLCAHKTSGVALLQVTTGGSGSALYRSTDGTNWAPTTAPSSQDTYYLPIGTNGFVASSGHCSMDGGQTWSVSTIPPTVSHPLTIVVTTGNIAIAATGSGSWVRSTDGGATWSFVQAPSPTLVSASSNQGCALGGKLFVGLMQSDDSGVTWHRRGLPARATIQKYLSIGANLISVNPTGFMFSGAASGVGIAPLEPATGAFENYLRVA